MLRTEKKKKQSIIKLKENTNLKINPGSRPMLNPPPQKLGDNNDEDEIDDLKEDCNENEGDEFNNINMQHILNPIELQRRVS